MALWTLPKIGNGAMKYIALLEMMVTGELDYIQSLSPIGQVTEG